MENGSRPKGGVSSIVEGVPSVGGEHLNSTGGFSFDNLRLVSEEFYLQMKRGHIRPRDILIVKDGATTGKVSFVSESFPYQRAAINEHIFLLRADTNVVLPQYLFFYLFSPRGQHQILSCFQGAAIGGISQSFARATQVPIPPLPEQGRIARLLHEADELRRRREQADHRTADLIPALFYEMFGEPSARPNCWKTVRVGDVAGIIVPTRDKPKQFVGDVPWVTLPDVTELFVSKARNLLTHDDAKQVANRLIPANSVLLSCAGSLGRVAVTTRELYANRQFYALTPRPDLINPVYLAASLMLKGEKYYLHLAGASTISFFSKQRALGIETLLAPLDLQRQFAARVAEIRALQARQAESRRRLDDLFQSMLHRAFQGEL
jgi:type I restriction enzyme S subunit